MTDPQIFARRFRQEILPLLQEYCYDDYGKLARYLGPRLVNAHRHTLIAEALSDPDALLEALTDSIQAPQAE